MGLWSLRGVIRLEAHHFGYGPQICLGYQTNTSNVLFTCILQCPLLRSGKRLVALGF